MRLELKDVLLGEHMCNDLALARVGSTVTGVEEARRDRNEGIVELGLEGTVSVAVDRVQGIWVSDGNVIWRDADNGTWDSLLGQHVGLRKEENDSLP